MTSLKISTFNELRKLSKNLTVGNDFILASLEWLNGTFAFNNRSDLKFVFIESYLIEATQEKSQGLILDVM